jgi:hypothetical protein
VHQIAVIMSLQGETILQIHRRDAEIAESCAESNSAALRILCVLFASAVKSITNGYLPVSLLQVTKHNKRDIHVNHIDSHCHIVLKGKCHETT